MKTKEEQQAEAAAYKDLVDVQAIHSEAVARLGELENDLQQAYLDLVDARMKQFAKLQTAISQAEEAAEIMCRTNPEWFREKRSVKTPYGTVSFRKSTKLVVKNEEVTILLLEQLGQDGLPFVEPKKALNLEALEKLEDEELLRIRVQRVTDDNFSMKPAKLDMGKAVKAAEKAHAKGGAK